MKIGIAAPIYLPYLSGYLDADQRDLPDGLGGFSVTYLVQAMLEQGLKLSIYTLDPKVTHPTCFSGKQLKVYVGPWRPRARTRILDFMRAERRLIEAFIREDAPEIVNAHWTYEFALGTIAAQVPHLITVRDWAPTILRFQKHPYRLLRLLMDRQCLRKGQKFAANSPYLQSKLAEKLKTEVALTPNAIPANWFLKGPKERQENFTICSINNGFTERKNVKALLEAFHICASKRENGHNLQLVGQGYESNGPAHQWARLNGYDKKVAFLGPLSGAEVRAVLDRADLLMHPALEESFGMTLVEAMARRVPVIGGASSGAVPWVLGHGQAGLLVEISSVAAITKGIEQMNNQETWSFYAEGGYNWAKENFHANSVAQLYLDLFRHVLREQ